MNWLLTLLGSVIGALIGVIFLQKDRIQNIKNRHNYWVDEYFKLLDEHLELKYKYEWLEPYNKMLKGQLDKMIKDKEDEQTIRKK